MELRLEAKRRGINIGALASEEVSAKVDQPEEDYFTETAKNVPGSAYQYGKDVVSSIAHPFRTINTLGEAFFGGIENIGKAAGIIDPESTSEAEMTADAIGEYYKKRAGSLEAIKETVKTDPVGALADVAAVTNVAGLASRAALPSKVSRGIQNVGAAMEPMNMAYTAGAAPYRAIPQSVKAHTTQAFQNLLPRNRARTGKALNEIAGDKAPEIIRAMEAQAKILPGSSPTAVQAGLRGGRVGPEGMGPPTPPVTRPQFAALDPLMAGRKPAAYALAKDQQRIARVKAIEDGIAKTPVEYKAAVKVRKDITDPMYAMARNDSTPIDINPVLDKIDQILKDKPGDNEVQAAFRQLKKGLTTKGEDGRIPRTKPEHIISSIEGMKKTISRKRNMYIKKELQDIKGDLVNSVPLYKQADLKYRELSRPINQMDIGKYLTEKIRPLKGDAEGSTKYLNALENSRLTIKNSLGEPRYKSLNEILDPKQMNILDSAKMELNRDAVIAAHAKKGSGKMKTHLDTALRPVEAPPMLSTKMMIVRRIMSRMKGAATDATLDYMAARQLNPKELAAIMKEATPQEKAILGTTGAARKRALVGSALYESGKMEGELN